MTKEEIIEKLKKLQRLADSGVDGERCNAKQRIEEIMRKYGIKDSDLADEEEKVYVYHIEGIFCWDLLKQIAGVMTKEFKIMYLPNVHLPRDIRASIKHFAAGKKHNVVMTCTAAQYVELTSKYEIIHRGLKQQADSFFYAFLKENDLLVESDGNAPEPTEEEIEMYERARRMSLGVDRVQVYKQLEGSKQ